jgi:hypothetical protein
MTDVSWVREFTVGTVAAFVEAIILQPTLYWKNARAQRLPFTIDPRVIYRGTGAAILNECGQMGLQYMTTNIILKALTRPDAEDQIMSNNSLEVFSALNSGAICALFANPVELVMIQQQKYGGSAIVTIQRCLLAKPSNFFRGFIACCARDGMYVGSMFGFTPMITKEIKKSGEMSPLMASLAASLMGGVLGSMPTISLDLVKTCMQGDLAREEYKTMSQTFGVLYKQGGIQRMFAGGLWRFINITGTIFVANEVTSYAKKIKYIE